MGVPLGGMTKDQARATLSQVFAEEEGQTLTLRYGDRRWTASAAELGLSYDLEDTLSQAYAAGRDRGTLDALRLRLGLMHVTQDIEPVMTTDRVRALDYLHRLARDIDVTMQNAYLGIDNLQVQSTPARTGYQLNVEASAARIAQALAAGQGTDIELTVTTMPPLLTDQGITEARASLQRLLSAPVSITFSGRDWTLDKGVATPHDVSRTWTIDRAQIAAATTLDQKKSGDQVVVSVRVDGNKFTTFFTSIAKELNRKSQDARFDYNVASGKLTPIQSSQEGRSVDVAENVKRLLAAAGSDNRSMQLAVAVTAPTLAVDQGSKLGIKEKVSEGVTTFAGSSEARAHNIRLAASKLDGATVAPGATFSLLDTLGPITAEAGYQEGYAIVGESTVTDVGGGVCQVATTAFRAAFWAGLPIVERNPHRYIVDRYFIKGGPVGLDAAIYDPGRDFQFKNTTGSYLIIKTDASDPANFTVSFYGTKPGWTVTMEDPSLKAGKDPGPRLPDIQDPTKAVGTRTVLAQPSKAGATASITRVVKKGTTVVSRDTFNTTYQPASEQWIVGTKK